MAVGKRLRFEVLKRDGFLCVYCGATAKATQLHVDHIVPVSKGGSDDPSNLTTSCETCNLGKSDVELHEANPRVAVPLAEAVARAEAAAQLADAQAAKARAVDALVDRARVLWSRHVGGNVPRSVDGALRRLVIGENADDLEAAMQAVSRKRGLKGQDKPRYFFGVLRRIREEREERSLTEAERFEKRERLASLGHAAFSRGAYEEAATQFLAARSLAFAEDDAFKDDAFKCDAFTEGRACLAAGWFDRALKLFLELADRGFWEWHSRFNAMLAAEGLGANDLALDLAERIVAGSGDPDLVESVQERLRVRRQAAQAREDRKRELSECYERQRQMKYEGRTFKSDTLMAVTVELEGRTECTTIPELKRSDRVRDCARAWGGNPETHVRAALVSLGWRKGALTESHPRARLWIPPAQGVVMAEEVSA